jgi:hypothetical protein
MFKFLSGLVDSNDKEIKRLTPKVDLVNELEPEFQKLSDDELKAKTEEFKARAREASAGIQPRLEEAQKELEEANNARLLPGTLPGRGGQVVPAGRIKSSRLKKTARSWSAKPWTSFCRRPSPSSGRPPGAPSASALSTCSSWAASRCTRGKSPR